MSVLSLVAGSRAQPTSAFPAVPRQAAASLLAFLFFVLLIHPSTVVSAATDGTASSSSPSSSSIAHAEPPYTVVKESESPEASEEPWRRCVHSTVEAQEMASSPVKGLTYVSLVPYNESSAAASVASVVEVDATQRRSRASTAAVEPARAARDATWQPLRIRAFSLDITDRSRYCTALGQTKPNSAGGTTQCTQESWILTEGKRNSLLNYVLPRAVQMHAERLNVQRAPADTAIQISRSRGRYCASFTIPEEHFTTGVADADFVVYVAAGPPDAGLSAVAWAVTCQYFADGRPAVGVVYFNPTYLPETMDETSKEIAMGGNANSGADRIIRVAAHEMLHSLGFSGTGFSRLKMVTIVPNLRGKLNVPVINTPKVRAAALAHYGCTPNDPEYDSFPGMEVEDEGEPGTSGSHWKRRSARDELMCPVTEFLRYTALSIAAMEDTGLYRGNYEKAEYMGWGAARGCSFVSRPCLVNQKSLHPRMFCDNPLATRLCSSTRLGVGYCSIKTYASALPAAKRYFENPTVGGGIGYADYCPMVSQYGNTGCKAGEEWALPGSVMSDISRCFDTGNGLRTKAEFATPTSLCVEVQCGNSTTDTSHQYRVRFKGSSSWVLCPPGTTIEPAASSPSTFQSGGTITCPPYEEVCQGNTNALFPVEDSKTDAGASPPHRAWVTRWCVVLIGFLILL